MSFFNLATLASSVGLTANKFAPGTPNSLRVLAKFPSTLKIDLSKNTKLFFDLTQISLFDAKTEERI